ncbi:hypothetical protein Nepgr_001465 [Nepenthes gracilis]|uniref:Uncharacterized protein n=1 Tax=Nepenthes gracilis TaxID=150966 RepID=A0AAD3P4W1_NEPGR|nr:hypothetical protein Nepgr_001465 [Nepenthes gracilis]
MEFSGKWDGLMKKININWNLKKLGINCRGIMSSTSFPCAYHARIYNGKWVFSILMDESVTRIQPRDLVQIRKGSQFKFMSWYLEEIASIQKPEGPEIVLEIKYYSDTE